MIKFTNVSKTYVSKSKSRVDALKNVSFELGSNGMTFILGKSGSGKSTLLNLLGGLDKPTSGTIQIDGVDMQSFTQSDFESYRNAYVGFVFQEYNLLDDFNVKDNVALALQLSKDLNVEEKVIEALKQVELNEEYLTRRVGELSGGEKQRVAIARAIVKESKMILADEPTGNLDSETGESIWNILKNLSQTRPVIIVSHDRESAEKYADRTIEIADGRITSDNGAEKEIKPSEEKTFTPVKQRLSFAMLLKMGFNSLFKRKARAITVILVSVFIVSALLVSQIMLTFLPERSVAWYVNLHGDKYVTLDQGWEDEPYGLKSTTGAMRYDTRNYIKKNAQTLDLGYVDSKQEALDFGLEFIGEALELDSQSFYITESSLESIYYFNEYPWRNFVLVDGEQQPITRNKWPAEKLVGRKVSITLVNERGENNFYTLAGVIKDINVKTSIWTSKDFEGYRTRFVGGIALGQESDYALEINGSTVKDYFYIADDSWSMNSTITSDGQFNAWDNLTLANDEIVIGFDLYSKLFNGGVIEDYVVDGEIVKMPSILGQTVSFKVRDNQTGDVVFDGGNCKIKGIAAGSMIYGSPKFYASAERNFCELIVKTDTVDNLQYFLVNLRTRYTGYVSDVGEIRMEKSIMKQDIARLIYDCEGVFAYGVIMIAICLVLVLVMILLVLNLISFSINSRKKEIGILSAIGASAWDITKIFIIETFIMSLFIFALALAILFGAVGVVNLVFSTKKMLVYTLTFFVVDPYTVLTLAGVSFVMLPLFALLPTIRIAKLKPIDAIRVL